jgi:hypothetical protein
VKKRPEVALQKPASLKSALWRFLGTGHRSSGVQVIKTEFRMHFVNPVLQDNIGAESLIDRSNPGKNRVCLFAQLPGTGSE